MYKYNRWPIGQLTNDYRRRLRDFPDFLVLLHDLLNPSLSPKHGTINIGMIEFYWLTYDRKFRLLVLVLHDLGCSRVRGSKPRTGERIKTPCRQPDALPVPYIAMSI